MRHLAQCLALRTRDAELVVCHLQGSTGGILAVALAHCVLCIRWVWAPGTSDMGPVPGEPRVQSWKGQEVSLPRRSLGES